jgi:hypothetical protein
VTPEKHANFKMETLILKSSTNYPEVFRKFLRFTPNPSNPVQTRANRLASYNLQSIYNQFTMTATYLRPPYFQMEHHIQVPVYATPRTSLAHPTSSQHRNDIVCRSQM